MFSFQEKWQKWGSSPQLPMNLNVDSFFGALSVQRANFWCLVTKYRLH